MRGDGTVTKVANGKYHLRWSVTIDGKRQQRKKVVLAKNLTEASSKLRKMIKASKERNVAEPGRLTLNDWLDRWVGDWLPGIKNQKPQTKQQYARMLRQYVRPEIGDERLANFTEGVVRKFHRRLEERGLSGSTARMAHHVLRMAMDAAVTDEKLKANPVRSVDSPAANEHEIDPPTPGEAMTLLDEVLLLRYSAAFRLCAFGGMRRGEACALLWKHVDFDNSRVLVSGTVVRLTGKGLFISSTKTKGSRRWVSFEKETMDLLRKHRKEQNEEITKSGGVIRNDEGYVFIGKFGGLLDPVNLTREWGSANKRLGLHYRLHDLRHMHATQLISARVPLTVVQRRLGHADVRTTLSVYAHAVPGEDAAAAEVTASFMNSGK